MIILPFGNFWGLPGKSLMDVRKIGFDFFYQYLAGFQKLMPDFIKDFIFDMQKLTVFYSVQLII